MLLSGCNINILKDSKVSYEPIKSLDNSVVDCIPQDGYYKIRSFNIVNKTLKAYGVKDKDAEQSDTAFLSPENDFALIKKRNGSGNDKLLDLASGKVYLLNSRTLMFIAENNDEILAGEYKETKWYLYSVDKHSGKLRKLNFELDVDSISSRLINTGVSYNNKFYFTYSDENGTYIVSVKKDNVSRAIISDQKFSNLKILDITDDTITMYKGYVAYEDVNIDDKFQPSIIKIEYANSVNSLTAKIVSDQALNTDKIGKGLKIVDGIKNDNGKIVMVFKPQEEISLRTALLTVDNNSLEKGQNTKAFDMQSSKFISGNLYCFDGDKVVKVDQNAGIEYLKN